MPEPSKPSRAEILRQFTAWLDEQGPAVCELGIGYDLYGRKVSSWHPASDERIEELIAQFDQEDGS